MSQNPNQSLTEYEALQAVRVRLTTELKPGDKIIIKRVEDGLAVYSEFREVRSENIKAGISHK